MTKIFDLSDYSEQDLTRLIDEAQALRQKLHDSRVPETAAVTGEGSKGQDVHDPAHGAITAPTPREVQDKGRAHGVE